MTFIPYHSFEEWANRLDQYAPASTHDDASYFKKRQAERSRLAYAARELHQKEAAEAELRG